MTVPVLPVLIGTALLLATIRWPRRWVPRLLAIVAGAVATAGVWLTDRSGDLSDLGAALVLATVVGAVAAWFERDGGVAPAAIALAGAAAVAAGLARLESSTGGFEVVTDRRLEPGVGWPLVIGATAIVVAAAARPRRGGVALLPAALWLGVTTAGGLEHGGDAIAIALAAGALVARRHHLAVALWAIAAAAVPAEAGAASVLIAAAAVLGAAWLHPLAALAAAPGAAALGIALVDDGSVPRLVLAALAVATVGRLWRPAGEDEIVDGTVSPLTLLVAALAAWLLLAPETWTWVPGEARLASWGTGVLVAGLAAAVGGYVAVSVRSQDVPLPAIEIADPSYVPGDPRRARVALAAAAAILGACGAWLLASALQ